MIQLKLPIDQGYEKMFSVLPSSFSYSKSFFLSPNSPLFCHSKPSPCQLPLHTPLFPFCLWSLLTCEQQHQAQGKKVWKWGQEVGHLQRESSPECLRDVGPNQAARDGAPGLGYTGSGCSNRRMNVYKQTETEPLLCAMWDIWGRRWAKKHLTSKSFFSWCGQGRPRWFTKWPTI